MSEDRDNPAAGKRDDDEESAGPRAGQRLAEARRARDISLAEVAKELHLDEPKVQALEENQFDVLGAPVFAKGHLRKYAELVGVSIDDVLTDYYKLNRAAGAPPVVGPVRKPQRDIRIGPWIVGLIAAGAIAAAAYWFMTRPTASEVVRTPGLLEPYTETLEKADDQQPESQQLPAPSISDTEPVDGDATADTPAPMPEPSPTSAASTEVAQSTSAAQPAGAEGQVTLVMSFSGECWTEVTDADGQRLFFGLGEAGRTITRTGTPPLQALFGNRNNVSVTVNGSEFPITSGGRRGNTARVTIDNP